MILGGPAAAVHILAGEIQESLDRRQSLTSIRNLVHAQGRLDPAALNAMARDVASSVLNLGIPARQVKARLSKALPKDPADPRRNHLNALIFENDSDMGTAVDFWLKYLEDLGSGRTCFNKQETKFALAAVLDHIARLMFDEYRKMSMNPFTPPWEIDAAWGGLAAAGEMIQRALDLDPDCLDYWRTKLDIHTEIEGENRRWKVLEEMLVHFPDDPKTLALSAQEAGRRKSADKGLRFIRRAQQLEPLNRDHRDTEAWLLLVKARKAVKSRNYKKARELYREAVFVPYLERERNLECRAEEKILAWVLGEEKIRLDLRSGSGTGDAGGDCLGLAWLIAARERMRPLIGNSNILSKLSNLDQSVEISERISTDQLSDILNLAKKMKELLNDRLPADLIRLTVRALNACVDQLTERLDFIDALNFLHGFSHHDFEIRFKAAEAAHLLHPNHPPFMYFRYKLAMILGKPAEYFQKARKELRDALDSVRDNNDPGMFFDDYHPYGRVSPDSFHMGHYSAYSALMKEIERYTRKKRSRGKKPKRETQMKMDFNLFDIDD